MPEYQRSLASMFYMFFDKKTGPVICVKEQQVEELCKPINKKFKRIQIYAIFKDNIWAA